MKQAPSSELEFLDALGVFSQKPRDGWVGPGDDAAVIPPPSGGLAFAADLLVEDVHFRLTTSTPEDVGWKALAVNVSDMAAMGARPLSCTVTLTVPETVGAEWFARLYKGMAEASERFDCPVVGGDLSRGPAVSISVAIIGECAAAGPVLRSGAKPGDRLYLTGATGESGAGLALLEKRVAALTESEKRCVLRHLRPLPRLAFGREVAARGFSTAMIDVSDGVLRDAHNLAIRSSVKIVVEGGSVPVSVALAEVSAVHLLDPASLSLGGGEDYELLFTAAPESEAALCELAAAMDLPLTRIGAVKAGEGVALLQMDGKITPFDRSGFDHFKER